MKPLQLDATAVWKQRFQIARYWGLQIAPSDLWHGAIISNQSGENQIYHWDLRSGILSPWMIQPNSMSFFSLSPDGQSIYYFKDEGGNDAGHIVRLSVQGKEEDVTPDLPPYAAFLVFTALAGNALGFTQAGREGYQTHYIRIGGAGQIGQRQLVHNSMAPSVGPWLSQDGRLALVASTKFSGDMNFGLIAIDTASGNPMGELWDGPGSSHWLQIRYPFSPVPGSNDILIQTNKTGVVRPGIWNPTTGERVGLKVESLAGNVSPLGWSPDGKQILLRQDLNNTTTYYLYHLDLQKPLQLPIRPGIYADVQFGGDKLLAVWEDPTHASQIIEIDPISGDTQPRLFVKDAPVCRDRESITINSSDRCEIQTWLVRPETGGPFPTILEANRYSQQSFHPESQLWLDHDFAFLSVKHRNIVEDFAEPGSIRALEDILSARAWLVQNRIADPRCVFLTGGSEGGYLTLLALCLYPEYWAGGLVWGPIADWKVVYEDGGQSRNLLMAYARCTPEDNPNLYAQRSPITYAENVRAPVQIFIGRNDNHVTTRQIVEYQQRLAALGKQVEVNWYEGGHIDPAERNTKEQIEYQERRLQFVYRALGEILNKRV
jgi:dienelactone hydrolase